MQAMELLPPSLAGMIAWLRDIHDRLDRVVLAAYGWPADRSDDDLLARLLALNLKRSAVPS